MQHIEFNVFYIIRSVKKHFRVFIAINALALALAIYFALTLPVKYEANATFYPYSPESIDPRIMLYQQADFEVFGFNDQVERYTKIGKSNSIKLYLGKKYNLYKSYDIYTGGDLNIANFQLIERLDGDIKFTKGEQGSVNIKVIHFNRDTASMMCNDLIRKIDSITSSLFVEKNTKIFELYKTQLTALEVGIKNLKDSISIVSNTKSGANEKLLQQLQYQLNFSIEEFTKTKSRYELTKSSTYSQLKTLFLIESAQPSYHKAEPKRKIIVGGTIAITFLITLALFTGIEFVKDNKEKFVF